MTRFQARATARALKLALALVLALGLGTQAASAAGLRADYRFAGTLASSCCSVGPAENLGANSFTEEVVGGASQTVLSFPLSSGVAIPPGVVTPGQYSVEVLFRLAEISGYRRIIDLSSATADRGLYQLNGQVYYWPIGGSSLNPPPIQANRYVRVVMTRDLQTVVVYANGVPAFTFDDSARNAEFFASNPTRFFKDDAIIPGEESAGAVARIRVYDGALTAAEVAALDERTISELPPPELGKEVNVEAASGKVRVAVPSGGLRGAGARASQKGLRFVPLEEARQIPTGSFLDTTKGTVELRSATGAGTRTQAGKFGAGVFQVLQSRARKAKGLTELRLKGSSFDRCRTRSAANGPAAEAAALSKKTIRRLRADGKGKYRTRGKHSAATVRGTVWITADRCDGTLTTVKRGKVSVRDFRRKRTITLRAGQSYLARAPR